MTLDVAIQMDPMDSVDIDADSTFALGLAAQQRGHRLYHYLPADLKLIAEHGGVAVTARARPMQLRRQKGTHVDFGPAEVLDLSAIDAVLLRQDPPFDMGYVTTTHILDHIHPDTLVVNNPTEVRNAPEKLFMFRFPDLVPPTLITRDIAEIRAFRKEHGDIVLKPLYGNGGFGVFHLRPEDSNLSALLELFAERNAEPLIVQRYLRAVREGDKRIILIDGAPVGAINRVPADGDARSNMHVGGRPEHIDLTERDREICAAIGPELKARGLIFVGIDVIGGALTEINVTSPTGIQEIERFTGADLAAMFWDAVEGRL